MKVLLVCGDRNWTEYGVVYMEIKKRQPDLVIEGEARGADQMAGLAARSLEIDVDPHPADWEKYGRAAGPIRNQEQLQALLNWRNQQGAEVEVVAFHNDIENSKGTKDMVNRAIKAGVKTTVITT